LNFETTDCDVLLLERFLMRSFNAVGVLAARIFQSLQQQQLLLVLLTVAVSLQPLLLLLLSVVLYLQLVLVLLLIEGVLTLMVKERTFVLTIVMALATPWAKLGVQGHRQV
jgi:hypothetical protein